MTREDAIKQLKELQQDGQWEASHSEADKILCSLLRELGYSDVVVEWEKVGKWYA